MKMDDVDDVALERIFAFLRTRRNTLAEQEAVDRLLFEIRVERATEALEDVFENVDKWYA